MATAAGTSAQARLNGELMGVVHNPAEVAFLNQGLQLIAATLIIVVSARRREALARSFRGLRNGGLRPWEILGGLGGAYFVAIQGVAATFVGVAAFTIAVVAGQTGMAAGVDRMGFGPFGRQNLTWMRVAAIVVAFFAVLIPTWSRLHSSPSWGLALVAVLSLAAGMASAVQIALNGRVAKYSGQPVVGAWANFALGALSVFVLVLIVHVLSGWQMAAVPSDKFWLLVAPLFGLFFIIATAWAVQVLGVLLLALVAISGQLIGAFTLDLVVPTVGTVVNLALIVGIVLALCAAALAAFGRRPVRL
jgi:transporter family-2 protein